MFCILGMSKPAHVQVQSLCDYISKNCISTSLTCFLNTGHQLKYKSECLRPGWTRLRIRFLCDFSKHSSTSMCLDSKAIITKVDVIFSRRSNICFLCILPRRVCHAYCVSFWVMWIIHCNWCGCRRTFDDQFGFLFREVVMRTICDSCIHLKKEKMWQEFSSMIMDSKRLRPVVRRRYPSRVPSPFATTIHRPSLRHTRGRGGAPVASSLGMTTGRV
jgi:hypothetical protein